MSAYADWPEDRKADHRRRVAQWRRDNAEKAREYNRRTRERERERGAARRLLSPEEDARITAVIRAIALHGGFYE